jgi:hypothetical protein
MQHAHAAMLAALCYCGAVTEAQTVVTISPESGALRAVVTLPAPHDRFAFESNNSPQRRDAWTPIGNGWRFDGETLRRDDGAPFARFELRLLPDTGFYDRRYVAVDRIGSEGWALFLAAFRANSGRTDVRLEGFPRDFVVRVGGETFADLAAALSPGAEDENRLAYVGPDRYVTSGPMTLVAGEEIPRWLHERLLRETGAVVEELTRRFGTPPSTAPTLFITYRTDERGSGTVAGALDDAVLTFALRGLNLDEENAALGDDLANTAAHEAAHVWNGEIWRSAQNEEQSWLHEGAAEYLASRIRQDPESLRVESERRLNDCALRSDRRPLDGSAGPVHAARYDCGFVIQLAAEAASLKAQAGDTFDLWRAVFEAADGGTYTAEAFLDEATRRGDRLLRVLRLRCSAASTPSTATSWRTASARSESR